MNQTIEADAQLKSEEVKGLVLPANLTEADLNKYMPIMDMASIFAIGRRRAGQIANESKLEKRYYTNGREVDLLCVLVEHVLNYANDRRGSQTWPESFPGLIPHKDTYIDRLKASKSQPTQNTSNQVVDPKDLKKELAGMLREMVNEEVRQKVAQIESRTPALPPQKKSKGLMVGVGASLTVAAIASVAIIYSINSNHKEALDHANENNSKAIKVLIDQKEASDKAHKTSMTTLEASRASEQAETLKLVRDGLNEVYKEIRKRNEPNPPWILGKGNELYGEGDENTK